MKQTVNTMCDRCDGLCCRVYDIFDSATGRRVKTADDKCGYLDMNNRCRIHTTRAKHAGYADSCEIYDCMEGGPIVTIFARRMGEHIHRSGIISSLLEVIRLRIIESPGERDQILLFVANGLNAIGINEHLELSIKVLRVKIERYGKMSIE